VGTANIFPGAKLPLSPSGAETKKERSYTAAHPEAVFTFTFTLSIIQHLLQRLSVKICCGVGEVEVRGGGVVMDRILFLFIYLFYLSAIRKNTIYKLK
jgi:hypothetical protein